jgi:hypothetical protein
MAQPIFLVQINYMKIKSSITLRTRLKLFRWGVPVAILFSIVLFICHGQKIEIDTSDLILFITALLLVWYAHETLALVELTRIKDQPFLEIEFQNNGAKVILKNFGSTPAYSPTISSIQIDGNTFDFDPLVQSQLPILPNDTRDFWVHHTKGSISSMESLPALKNAILNSPHNSFLKVVIECFDKDGEHLKRNLYLKVGGLASQKKYIYTSTSSNTKSLYN